MQGYVQPIADLFGANMNAGFYHTAAIARTGLTIRLDIVAMGALVKDEQKVYTANAPTGFTLQGGAKTFQTATVFGDKGTKVTDLVTGFSYRGSDGVIKASILPLAAPQLTIGDIFGTQATVRFLTTPELSNGKFPKVTLFGIGARHSISQYLPVAPLDISAGVFYNTFKVGDLIDFSSVSFGAQASKTFLILGLYGGVAWEKSTMTLSYKPSNSLFPPVSLDLSGENTIRFTVGAALELGFLHIFADANFGSVTNFSGGIGLGI